MDKLLARYVRNECSPQEEKQVIDYLQNPANEPKLHAKMWVQWQQAPAPIDSEPNWQRLWQRIEKQTALKPYKLANPSNLNAHFIKGVIWLCLLLALGFSLQFLQNWYIPMALTYHTNPDERLKIVLPDSSSTVILNGNSTLHCFPKNTRPNGNVWIQGEGYFTVSSRKKNNPLLVHASPKVSLKVNKGSFYLSNRDSLTRLVVGQHPIALIVQPSLFGAPSVQSVQEGEIVEFDKGQGLFSAAGIDSPDYLDWAIPYLH
ncbi:FecR domain-containing protein [Tellurirhabdus bombi]|uniref:FecR domain-containing protein n=1 Tax=Tellurirhabdus bombi TaxID=2907205 RepID=UPI001F307955|nr:FecR family protein [Tellurirhabdus bombi]